jgi:hypothetical protein
MDDSLQEILLPVAAVLIVCIWYFFIDKKRGNRINKMGQKQIDNDKWVQNFLIKGTKEKLLKKTKQRLLNIAKKDLNIELDPSMKKNEMVEKIYVYYHNLKNEDTKEDKKEKRMGTEPVNLNEDLYDY